MSALCIWCDAPECDCRARIDCTLVGEPGHQQCGWCYQCNGPRFQCAHPVPAEDETPHEAVNYSPFQPPEMRPIRPFDESVDSDEEAV